MSNYFYCFLHRNRLISWLTYLTALIALAIKPSSAFACPTDSQRLMVQSAYAPENTKHRATQAADAKTPDTCSKDVLLGSALAPTIAPTWISPMWPWHTHWGKLLKSRPLAALSAAAAAIVGGAGLWRLAQIQNSWPHNPEVPWLVSPTLSEQTKAPWSGGPTQDQKPPKPEGPKPMLPVVTQQMEQDFQPLPKKTSLKKIMQVLETFPTQLMQKRLSVHTIAGNPAFTPEEIEVVSWYLIWQFMEGLNLQQQKFFLGEILGMEETSETDPQRLPMIKAFKVHLGKFIPAAEPSATTPSQAKHHSGMRKLADFEDLERIFTSMSPHETFQRLEASGLMTAEENFHLVDDWHAKLKSFITDSSPFKRHLFYRFALQLDESTIEEIGTRWHKSDASLLKNKGRLRYQIITILGAPGALSTEPNQDVEQQFLDLSHDQLRERLLRSYMYSGGGLETASWTADWYSDLRELMENSSPLKRQIFYSTFLHLDNTDLSTMAQESGVPEDIVFELSVRMQGQISLLLQGKQADSKSRSLVEMDAEFVGMSHQQVFAELRILPAFYQASFDPSRFNELHTHILTNSSFVREVFYSLFLHMDSYNANEIIRQLRIDDSAALRRKNQLTAKIIQLFELHEYAGRVIPFEEMEETFAHMSDKEVVLRLRDFPKLAYLNFDLSRIGDLRKVIARSQPIKRHVFYSNLLMLDSTPQIQIAKKWGLTAGSAGTHKAHLIKTISKVFLGEGVGRLRSFKELDADFSAMSQVAMFEALQKSEVFTDIETRDMHFSELKGKALRKAILSSSPINRHVFYSAILNMDGATLTDLAKTHSITYNSAWMRRQALHKKILSILIPIRPNSKKVQRASISRPFEEMENMFHAMASEDIRELLHNVPKLTHRNFDTSSIETLRQTIASSPPARRHVFYSAILMLDNSSIPTVAARWQMSRGAASFHKTQLLSSMEQLFKSASPAASVSLDFADLEHEFEAMTITTMLNRLGSARALSKRQWQLLELSEPKGKALREAVLASSAIRRHIFYSIMLKMDSTSLAEIARQNFISIDNAEEHRLSLYKQVLSLLGYQATHITKPSKLLLSDMESAFVAMSYREMFTRLQKSTMLKSYDLEKKTSNFDLMSLRNYVLDSRKLTKHLFYSITLEMDQTSLEEIAGEYYLSENTVKNHQDELHRATLTILKLSPPISIPTILSFGELEQAFLALEPAEVLHRLSRHQGLAAVKHAESRYPELHEFILSKPPMKRHVFYSLILRLDHSSSEDIAAVQSMLSNTIRVHKRRLLSSASYLLLEPQ